MLSLVLQLCRMDGLRMGEEITFNYNIITNGLITVNFVNPADPMVHTQAIEATWGALKTSLRHLHGTNKEMLPSYLYQYMLRRFHNNQKIFQHILEEIRKQFPV